MKVILSAASEVKQLDLSKRDVSLLLLGPMAIWLGVFLVIPLLFVFVYGFLTYESYSVVWEVTLSNYLQITDPVTFANMIRTFAIAITVIAL